MATMRPMLRGLGRQVRTAVSNTDGSITSSVSANAQYGFSVVTWTGTATAGTIGHGLNGKVPKFIITKRRDSSGDWYCQHASLVQSHRIQLNSNSAATSGTSLWNSTSPTGSVFSIGADNEVNASSGTFVAYCFADVPGYQRIGTYYSNSSDPTVITGFKPRFLLVKKHNATGHWMLLDSQRSGDDDDIRTTFEINNSNAEETHANRQVKFLNNGFQLIGADMETPVTAIGFTGQSVMTRLGRMRIVLLTYQMQSLQMRTQRHDGWLSAR